MAFLFTIERNTARPNTETLLLSPYKEIWERDTSEDKNVALREFSFIEFMVSKKKTNPFAQYEKSIRLQEVTKSVFGEDTTWTPDQLVVKGMDDLHILQTKGSLAYEYLLGAESVMEKLKLFFLNVDLNERTRGGTPVYKPKEITTAMNDINENLKNLHITREMVEQELYETSRTRSNREINPFEV